METKVWRYLLKIVDEGGTIEKLSGKIPTKYEATKLIEEAGGKIKRVEGPEKAPNPHNYNHINYTTSKGLRGTIQIQDL